jgi:tetratricopeptide (TPR) repeat protein
MSRGDMIGAISEFSQAILANGRDTDAYIGRGKAFQSTGGHELAMRDFNDAIARDPKSASAYAARGSINYELSAVRPEDREMLLSAALDDLNQAVALDANCAEAYKYRSLVYSALDGNVLEVSRGSRAVYDAYLSLTLKPGISPANG